MDVWQVVNDNPGYAFLSLWVLCWLVAKIVKYICLAIRPGCIVDDDEEEKRRVR